MTELGIMFRREHPPEALPAFVRQAEKAGFDSLWVVEDCFYGSGIASAAKALSESGEIKVGLGIMPAVVRNPVFTAMEIATLSRLYPDRFLPGIGHGVASWMRQIGALPTSQLRALEEVAGSVRRLLHGENVTYQGSHIQLHQAQLLFPPERVPPVLLGVRGPKSFALSGRVADGTILAEFAPPAYVSWARQQINNGIREAGHGRSHHLTVFAYTCLEDDIDKARGQLRPLVAAALANGKIDAHINPMGILPEVKKLLEDGGETQLEQHLPDAWIDQLNVVGPPEQCADSIGRLVEAGADSVVLVPLPYKNVDELKRFADRLLPLPF